MLPERSDMRRFLYIFAWSFLCSATQYGTSLLLGYLHFANTAMRLLPLIFLGIAGAAIVAHLVRNRWIVIFPVIGFCVLSLGILFF